MDDRVFPFLSPIIIELSVPGIRIPWPNGRRFVVEHHSLTAEKQQQETENL
jgi:hypothetical protein